MVIFDENPQVIVDDRWDGYLLHSSLQFAFRVLKHYHHFCSVAFVLKKSLFTTIFCVLVDSKGPERS